MANINNNQFDRQKFGNSLEQFEIAKLRRKYEELGYEFKEDFKPRRKNFQTFDVDAYAINRVSGDEIIFEVKSMYSYNKLTTQDIRKKREEYLKWFPRAKFVLVLAREAEPFDFEFPHLAELLSKYIFDKETYNFKFDFSSSGIRVVDRPFSVVDLECTSINFEETTHIHIKGYGTLRFWHYIRQKEFIGNILHDGIPFYYDIILKLTQEKPILDVIEIKFDFSEFGLSNSED